MNRLTRCTSDSTDRKTLRRFLRRAVVTCCDAFLDDLHLSIETCGAALDQRYVCSQTHLVDVSSGFQIIQSVEHHGKILEPIDVELGVFDVGMVSLELHVWIEFVCCILGHLSPIYQYCLQSLTPK